MFSTRVVRRCSLRTVIVIGCVALVGPLARADDATIQVDYRAKPSRPLPSAIRVITVKMPNYLYRDADDGIMHDDERGWYRKFIRNLQSQVMASAPDVTVTEWEDWVSLADEERRRILRGGDPDAPAADAPEPTDATMIVRFRVTASTYKIKARKSLLRRIGRVIAHRLISSSDGETMITRVKVNVQCDINFAKVTSGKLLYPYAEDLEAIADTDPGFLGFGGRSAADLPSAQRLTAELIEEHVDNYLSEYLPVQRTVHATLSDVHGDVRQAIEALQENDYQKARFIAWKRYERKHRDYAACFVAGLSWEVEQNWDEAVNWYRRASGDESQNSYYHNALERATAALHNQRAARTRTRSAVSASSS